MIAAAFTFGLPVEQLEVITAQSVTSVKHLLRNVGDAKRLLGTDAVLTAEGPVSSTNPSVPPVPIDPILTDDLPTTAIVCSLLRARPSLRTDSPEIVRAQQGVNLSTSCDNDPKSFSDIVEGTLSAIMQTTFDCNRPPIIVVQTVMLLSTIIHLSLVWCLLTIILWVDPSTLMWDCRDAGWLTVGLILGVLCFVGPLRMRFERKAFAATDVIHISNLTASNSNRTHFWSRLQNPHPMVVILRPSANATFDLNEKGSNGIRLRVVYSLGVLQLCWILFLSFFFSSSIGDSLFWSLLVVWTFVLAVSISRGLSILTIWLVEKHIGLQVIEYDDLLELEVIRGLIGALPKAHVKVKGNTNSLWEKGYLQGQSVGYRSGEHEVITSFIGFPGWAEVIPMVSALIVVSLILLNVSTTLFVGVGFNGVLTTLLTFGFVTLFKGKEKCIVLCNRGADADQA